MMPNDDEWPEKYTLSQPTGYSVTHWLPRWLVPLLVVLFLLSTVGAIGGGWYIAHRLDVDTVNDD